MKFIHIKPLNQNNKLHQFRHYSDVINNSIRNHYMRDLKQTN